MRKNMSEAGAEERARQAKAATGASAPIARDTRQLAAHSRARVRDERSNLRRFRSGRAATDSVIKRAILAYTQSMSLLRD